MGVWAVAVLDNGAVDRFEATYGPNLYEWDFFNGDGETTGGRSDSHGSRVSTVVEQTNSALERIDLQVISNQLYSDVSVGALDQALGRLIELDDQGWRIGSVNLSLGWNYSDPRYLPELDALAARGIFAVAAAGNAGSHSASETPIYPAALDNVIAVGSHDGAGNPTAFSQNHPDYIHVLADGEGVPGPANYGTSYAAPQVAAGVATVQALAVSGLGRRLGFEEVVDVLRQGGGATLSNPDPFSGDRYFLFDHARSVEYFLQTYLDPEFSGYEYLASYADVEAALGADAAAARQHFVEVGVYEGRTVGFDGLEYIASHADLIAAFGTDRAAGALHYLGTGRVEGRTASFDGEAYLAAYADLQAAFGDDADAATRHYIETGHFEGRTPGPMAAAAPLLQQPDYTSSSDGLL